MEKELSEKKTFALAECRNLLKDKVDGQMVHLLGCFSIQKGWIDVDGTDYEAIYLYLNARTRIVAYLWVRSDDWEINLFYSLLGLLKNNVLLETLTGIKKDISSLGLGYDEMDEFICKTRQKVSEVLG